MNNNNSLTGVVIFLSRIKGVADRLREQDYLLLSLASAEEAEKESLIARLKEIHQELEHLKDKLGPDFERVLADYMRDKQ